MGNIDKITQEQFLKIREDYLSGASLRSLSKTYKCRNSDMSDFLKSRNVKVRSRGQQVDKSNYRTNVKYGLNEDFFEIINTQEKAYWLGFLFADGSVTNKYKRRRLELALKEEDGYHIDNLSEAMSSNSKATKKVVNLDGKEYIAYRCVWNSEKLVSDLSRHGCVPNKSLILEFPKKIKEKYIFEFVRGYFEGDGCVWYHKYDKTTSFGISIIGTENFCKRLTSIFKDYNIKSFMVKSNDKKCFEIRITGMLNIYNFYINFYKNKDSKRMLKRKDDIFKQIFFKKIINNDSKISKARMQLKLSDSKIADLARLFDER